MIRIVLIDDHTLMRTGLRLIVDKQPDMEIIAEAEDGEPGIALIKRLQPDVALVDVHMPGVSGVEVTERVRRAKLQTRIEADDLLIVTRLDRLARSTRDLLNI